MEQAGASAAPLAIRGKALPALGSIAVIYPREEARTPGASTREAAGAPDRAPAHLQPRPLRDARSSLSPAPGPAARPPAVPPGAHRSARCLRPAERLRPAAGTPRGAVATHTGSLRAADASSVPAVRVGGGRRHVVRQLVAGRPGRRQRALARAKCWQEY